MQRRHADAAACLDAGLEYCIDRDLDSWTLYLQGWQASEPSINHHHINHHMW